MRNSLSNKPLRRRVMKIGAGVAMISAVALPGVAWANDAIPGTAPVVVEDGGPGCTVTATPLPEGQTPVSAGEALDAPSLAIQGPAAPADSANIQRLRDEIGRLNGGVEPTGTVLLTRDC